MSEQFAASFGHTKISKEQLTNHISNRK